MVDPQQTVAEESKQPLKRESLVKHVTATESDELAALR